MKKLLFTIVSVMFAMAINAQTFTIGSLNYSVNEDGTSVTVTGHVDQWQAVGTLNIPETVTYNGNTYTVTDIGYMAFYQCENLTGALVIPNSVITIGKESFRKCSGFESLTIGNNVTTIGEGAFRECSGFTGTLSIPNSVTVIGTFAFYHCTGFTGSLTIPNSVKEIHNSAFCRCYGLTGTLDLGNSLEKISYSAFSHDNFTGSLYIPETVDTIGVLAFAFDDGFTDTLVISSSVKFIDVEAFNWCSGFTKVISLAIEPPTLAPVGPHNPGNVFDNGFNCSTLIVPCGSKEAYENSAWHITNGFETIIEDCDYFELQGTEWYYEIINNSGDITYQYLLYESDTVINDEKVKVIVKTNTLYDKNNVVQTHEYIYNEEGVVYWWNKELSEFTTLYNFAAVEGDEWEIKIGNESIIMHVDAVGNIENNETIFKTLTVSDENDIFSGTIVCGIGHQTSFFPEKLLNKNKNFEIDGIRCNWDGSELLYQEGDVDCDEIYENTHFDVNEIYADNGFEIYPNPSNGILFVQSENINSEYRITNILGETVASGKIASETQQINVSSLPEGMYFLTIGNATMKFMKK